MSYPAKEVSIQRLLGRLQDGGNGTSIENYLDMMVSGYAIKALEKYSTRPLTKKSSSPKLTPLCPALIHAFTDPNLIDDDKEWCGRVFESVIGAQLCMAYDDLCYWRDGNHEVDFVIPSGRAPIAIEVKSGRKKSAAGLSKFKEAFPNAETILMDLELGEKFLLSRDPKQFISNLI
jgi:predicted AAA+ superfamily ATPase